MWKGYSQSYWESMTYFTARCSSLSLWSHCWGCGTKNPKTTSVLIRYWAATTGPQDHTQDHAVYSHTACCTAERLLVNKVEHHWRPIYGCMSNFKSNGHFFFLSPSLVCQLLRQISGKLVLGKCLTFFTNHWFMSLSNALKSSSSSSSSLICVSSVAGHSLTGSSTVFGFVLSG